MSNFVENALFPVFPTESPLWAVPIHLKVKIKRVLSYFMIIVWTVVWFFSLFLHSNELERLFQVFKSFDTMRSSTSNVSSFKLKLRMRNLGKFFVKSRNKKPIFYKIRVSNVIMRLLNLRSVKPRYSSFKRIEVFDIDWKKLRNIDRLFCKTMIDVAVFKRIHIPYHYVPKNAS